jgi:coenzyme PQQ precursor peptide PqqA
LRAGRDATILGNGEKQRRFNALENSYGTSRVREICRERRRHIMTWSKPVIREYCVGMEVTSYDSAEIDPLF